MIKNIYINILVMSNTLGPFGNIDYTPARNDNPVNNASPFLTQQNTNPIYSQPVPINTATSTFTASIPNIPNNSEKFAPSFSMSDTSETNILADIINYMGAVFRGEYGGYAVAVLIISMAFCLLFFVAIPLILAVSHLSEDKLYVSGMESLTFYNSLTWWKVFLYKGIYLAMSMLFGPIYLIYSYFKKGFK